MAYDVFISHTEEDRKIAIAACDALEREGIACWIAPRDVPGGTEWPEAIIGALKQSRAMLLIFSSYANNSRQIKREVNYAIEQNLPVFMFRVENVLPTGTLEYLLDVVHWLDAFDSAPEQHLPRLTADIRRYLTEPASAAPPPSPRVLARQTSHAVPKWWIWIAAGLLGIILMVVVWRYLTAPIIVGPSPTPTPTGAASPNQASLGVTATPTVSPGGVVASTVTPVPSPINKPSPVPDETDPRIARAIEVLGNPNHNELAARNAISALAPLIKKSIEHQRSIVPMLTSYIQRTAVWREDGTKRAAKPPPPDIQEAITVLAQRKWGYDQGEPRLELSYADLRGIDFKRGDFDGVNLLNAHLERADLTDASFRCANLGGAYVKGIDVSRTDFDGTELRSLRESNASEMGVALRNKGTAKCTH